MTINIRGIPNDLALRSRVASEMSAALLRVKPVAAQVAFFDENGPKGGVSIRCALTVRLPRWPTLRVEQVGETARLAFDGGLAMLKRQIERHSERARDQRRRPKKYYAAKRLLTGGEPPETERQRQKE